MIRKLLVLFGLIVAALLSLTAYHLASVKSMEPQLVPITHWEDRSGSATIRDVLRVRSFTPVRQHRINIGYTESVHWFRIRLATSDQLTERSLEIRNPTIDRLELFQVNDSIITSLGQAGSRLPFAQRPSPTKTFVYLLPVDAVPYRTTTDFYLRIDKRYENLATELTVWQTSDLEDREQREYFLWGIFAGVVGLVVLLAFLFYGATLDPVYSWYGLYILGLALRQFADTGLGFQYLWPRLPAINQPDAVIEALWLYIPALLQFQQYFLRLRTESKRVFWATQVFKWTFAGLFVALVVGQLMGLTETHTGAYRLITRVHTILASGVFLVFIAVAIVGLRTTAAVTRLYAAGLSIQMAGQLLIIIQNTMRNQSDGVFFVDAYMLLIVNFFIDLVVLFYLLAYRYRRSIDDERQLQISLAQTRQQTNDAIIDVLESERQQIARLLLTEVGGRLTNTRAMLTALPPVPLLSEAVDLLDKTDANLDQILRDDLPPDLMQKGLPAALSELVERCCRTSDFRLVFQAEGCQPAPGQLPVLSATETRQLYRMTNELIANSIRHAKATEGLVSLQCTSAGWQLIVSDNGQGFDVKQALITGGIGLKNLYNRAQTIDATVQLDAGPTGTTVRLLLPKKIQTS